MSPSVFRVDFVLESSIRNVKPNASYDIKFFSTLTFQSFTLCFMEISSILYSLAKMTAHQKLSWLWLLDLLVLVGVLTISVSSVFP